jgi:hypothetical protein
MAITFTLPSTAQSFALVSDPADDVPQLPLHELIEAVRELRDTHSDAHLQAVLSAAELEVLACL